MGISRSTAYRQLRVMGIFPKPRLSIPKSELETLYCIKGKSATDIAKLYGCDRTAILDRLRYFRIPVRTSAQATKLAGEQKKTARCGVNHHNWKGGRTLRRGYVYVYAPYHPRRSKSRYVAEHVLVWEQTHHQPLPTGWIIHHLNGDKTDNRPENLAASPSRNHRDFIIALQQRIRQLEGANGQNSQM